MQDIKRLMPIILIGLITFVFIINFALGATVINPTSSSIIGGTVVLNASNGTNFFANLTNCTFSAVSLLSGNNTQIQIAVANASGTGVDGMNNTINASFSSRILEDSNDYTFSAVCWARTNAGVHYQLPQQTNVTSVRIDNSVPLSATSLSPVDGNRSTNKSIVITSTVTGNVTTSCTIRFTGINPNETSIPMTHSGNTCTAQIQGLSPQTYEYYIRTSDQTNTSDSAVQRFTITKVGGYVSSGTVGAKSEGSSPFSVASSELNGGNQGIIKVLLIAGGIILLIYLITRKR